MVFVIYLLQKKINNKNNTEYDREKILNNI